MFVNKPSGVFEAQFLRPIFSGFTFTAPSTHSKAKHTQKNSFFWLNYSKHHYFIRFHHHQPVEKKNCYYSRLTLVSKNSWLENPSFIYIYFNDFMIFSHENDHFVPGHIVKLVIYRTINRTIRMISRFSHQDVPRFASSLSHTQGTLEQIKANRELKRRKELLKDRKVRRVGEWGLAPGWPGARHYWGLST